MLKLLLEKQNRTFRENDAYEVEVKDLAEAVKVFRKTFNGWGSSEFQHPESGRVTFEDGTTNFIAYNGRIWDREYWISSKGACYNKDAVEVFA